MILHNFGYGPATICKLAKNGLVISCADALDGAKYGWYECRLSTTGPTERVACYTHDKTMIGAALGAAGLFTILALTFGK